MHTISHFELNRLRVDRDVLEGLIQAIPAHDFLFGRFTGIADAMGCECA